MKSKFANLMPNCVTCVALYLGLVGCASTQHMKPDSNWTRSETRFGSIDISIATPPNERQDYFPEPAAAYIEIGDGRFNRPAYSVTVLKKWWGIRGPMSVKYSGTLGLQVRIFRRPPDFEGNLLSDSELGELKASLLRDPGRREAFVQSPKVTADRSWSRVEVRGASDMQVYCTALSDEHYIQVQAALIDNTAGANDAWREEAIRIFEAIIETVRIDRANL